jgi:glycosyltransferase involved in cell wall biosynthesis
MLRVLHCIYDDPANPWVGGGGAVRAGELYRQLAREVDATVVTGAFPGAADGVEEGVRYRRVGASSPYAWSRLSYGRAANRLLRREAYDAAVFDFSVYTPIFVPRDRPVGITVHHVTSPTAAQRWGRLAGGALARLERRMLARGAIFSATSSATHRELRSVVGPGARILDVEAGVPEALFELRREEQEYLLYFGRLDWFQKGLDLLLDAVEILARRDPAMRLRIAGRGKDAARVREEIGRRRLGDQVLLLGPVDEAERLRLFAGARALLMPSRFEGFGMVAAEAMAAGVPVVAAASGSLPEVVAPPDGGILVEPGDAMALADAVSALLASPERRHSLSRSGRTSAERFRWGRIAERHLDFLHTIAAADRPRVGR